MDTNLPPTLFPVPTLPPAIAGLIAALAPVLADSNLRAVRAGKRYRRAFWSLYLLSALAVLCAVMPLALGWDDPAGAMHPWAAYWAMLEVLLITVVGTVYLVGQRRDWQGQWLASRTEAELIRYLPLVAPLVVPGSHGAAGSWYARLKAPALRPAHAGAIELLCARLEPAVHASLHGAWSDPVFLVGYAAWARSVFESQRAYHDGLALRSEALMRRLHRVKAALFVLTLGGALAHLALHWIWLSFMTIFFPALAASLHGALAQTESYRLAAASRRLSAELGKAIARIGAGVQDQDAAGIHECIETALQHLLDEHLDWHKLVRPHHLPLG